MEPSKQAQKLAISAGYEAVLELPSTEAAIMMAFCACLTREQHPETPSRALALEGDYQTRLTVTDIGSLCGFSVNGLSLCRTERVLTEAACLLLPYLEMSIRARWIHKALATGLKTIGLAGRNEEVQAMADLNNDLTILPLEETCLLFGSCHLLIQALQHDHACYFFFGSMPVLKPLVPVGYLEFQSASDYTLSLKYDHWPSLNLRKETH